MPKWRLLIWCLFNIFILFNNNSVSCVKINNITVQSYIVISNKSNTEPTEPSQTTTRKTTTAAVTTTTKKSTASEKTTTSKPTTTSKTTSTPKSTTASIATTGGFDPRSANDDDAIIFEDIETFITDIPDANNEEFKALEMLETPETPEITEITENTEITELNENEERKLEEEKETKEDAPVTFDEDVELVDVDVLRRRKRQTPACRCVEPPLCNNTGITDGAGLIDIRERDTKNNTEVIDLLNFRVVGGGKVNCSAGLVYCCLNNTSSPQISCGSRITSFITYPLENGEAKYGDYPWMALIITTKNAYIAGGVLIDYQNVLTTAHKVSLYKTNITEIKVRLGEWDTAANYEQYSYKEYTIAKIWIHEGFNVVNLKNDVALIKLSTLVITYPTVGVVPICMPTSTQIFDGRRCWVSGWGKDQFGPNGRYQTILRATDVPIINSTICQIVLRTTRLGSAFLLDKASFICAGGEDGKDACTGDGGSGLVCEVSAGRWVLAGLVAWGIGCAASKIPAAYVNVATYIPWIQSKQSE